MERWITAYAAGEKDTVVNLFHYDAALTYIGSADEEIWRGEGLPRALGGCMDDIPKWSLSLTQTHGYTCGAAGWVDMVATTRAAYGDRIVTFRSTFVLALDRGVWRLVHIHPSNPAPNEQGMGYEARGFDELLEAASDMDLGDGITGLATIMFTDIAGSTALAGSMGGAAWMKVLDTHLASVADCVETAGGQLVKSLGDGTMSAYGSVRAALIAAQAIQSAARGSQREPVLGIRIALHVGDVVQARDDFFGSVVNMAARIAAEAAPGEILVSDAAFLMVQGNPDVSFAPARLATLKGFAGEHRIHPLH